MLDVDVPRLIQDYLKTNYNADVYQKFLEYSKINGKTFTYSIERNILAYNRLIKEKIINRAGDLEALIKGNITSEEDEEALKKKVLGIYDSNDPPTKFMIRSAGRIKFLSKKEAKAWMEE